MKPIYVLGIILFIIFGVSGYLYYQSTFTAAPSISALPTAPQFISNYQANQITFIKANSANAAIIKWNPPSLYPSANLLGFNVYRGTASGLETYIGSASPSQFSYLDQNLQTGQVYWYYVTAIFPNGIVGLVAPEISIQN